MPIATQRALVRAIREWESPDHPAFVSLDPHLPASAATLDEWRELLASVDLFLPSDDEMQWPDALSDPARALAGLASGRLRYIAWKRGAAGGLMLDARADKLQRWAPGATHAVDPTGAGDAFAAGFVSAWLEGQAADAALLRAVESADRVIGAWGPEALLETTPAGAGLGGKARAAARAATAAARRRAPGLA
jgi:sugar/nucleoside kinase (ribokinase family)